MQETGVLPVHVTSGESCFRECFQQYLNWQLDLSNRRALRVANSVPEPSLPTGE